MNWPYRPTTETIEDEGLTMATYRNGKSTSTKGTRKSAKPTTRTPGARRGLGVFKGALAVVLVAKLMLASAWMVGSLPAQAKGEDALGPLGRANHPALEPVAVSAQPMAKPSGHDEAKSLLLALSRRQAELETREREIVAREDRLVIYEKDLEEKIAHLESLHKEMSRESKAAAAADAEAAQSLAKVYAAMKPAEAAPLLDRLDDDTVLRILAHMRAKQIGELLPLLNRDKAIVLTQALASGK